MTITSEHDPVPLRAASPAPVAVFAYKRPVHLRRTLESLAANALAKDTDLHLYCDAAKTVEAAAGVAEVRRVVTAASGFASVRAVHRDANFGLAASIIAGTTEIDRAYSGLSRVGGGRFLGLSQVE